MKHQKGVSLSGLLLWGGLFALVALVAVRVVPSVIEYYKIVKDTKAIVADAPPGVTVPDLRRAYAKYVEVDVIESVRPDDLDISKDDNQIVVAFAYEKKMHLVGPVSLLIDFHGSTGGSRKGE